MADNAKTLNSEDVDVAKTKLKEVADGQWRDTGIQLDTSLNFKDCKWIEAVNWHPKFTGTFGYLLSWEGETPLVQDLTLVDPARSRRDVPDAPRGALRTIACVGVIEQFYFGGSPNDPITIVAHVSGANAATIHGMYRADGRTLDDPSVELQWDVWTCEGSGETWYESAHTGSSVSAMVATDEDKMSHGGNLRVNVADKCSEIKDTNLSEAVDIRLFKFGFQIIPVPDTMTPLLFQKKYLANIVVKWGRETTP